MINILFSISSNSYCKKFSILCYFAEWCTFTENIQTLNLSNCHHCHQCHHWQ